MTTMEHSVAPEDVMALLDGELPVAEARVVSAHLEQCAECAMLAEELRGASRLLSRWSVATVPKELQDAVMSAAAKASVGGRLDVRKGWSRGGGFWNWKLFVSGGAAALALLALVVFSPTNTHQYSSSGQARMLTFVDGNLQSPRFEDKVRAPEPLYDQAQKATAGVAGMSGGPIGGLLPPPAPMIARTVALTIVVKDVDAARASLDSILVQHRGYSAQLNTFRPENGPRSLQSSLRIPADELQTAVAAIKTLGRMETESQSGEEVSQQHADLVARLKTARETEERFRDILQQRTGKVGDVLEVEQSIARVRGEIEGMEAEQKALEHRVDFASVNVQLREEYKARFDSSTASVSTRMHNAFVAGYQNATESLLGFVLFVEEYGPSLLLWLVILGLPVVLAWRRYKRIRSSI